MALASGGIVAGNEIIHRELVRLLKGVDEDAPSMRSSGAQKELERRAFTKL
jgi:hypothetical protein